MEQNSVDSEKGKSVRRTLLAIALLAVIGTLGFFVYTTTVHTDTKYPFVYGLDLAGGSQLIYSADTSGVNPQEAPELMDVLKSVIERRIDVFGVAEPNIQVQRSSIVAGEEQYRLIVELPGVTDTEAAIAEIGRTPLLEFKLVNEEVLLDVQAIEALEGQLETEVNGRAGDAYVDTGLTGRYVEQAELVFGQGQGGLANEPVVNVQFTDEGAELFEEITTEHVGEFLAIFLDGEIVSVPRINEPIPGGSAVISGNFTATEARDLVQNLNFGALPLPIAIDSTQSIGASLGEAALEASIYAGIIGFAALALFMVAWYRLTGAVAVLALVSYVIIMLALFKLIPVTLTAAGLAGLILSIGMAVDANILIAERIKEELRDGKTVDAAIREGFARAWLAIRDANITSILAAIILFWFGTSLIKGFAFVLGIGVFVSMFSAIIISRTLLMAIPLRRDSKIGMFLMSSGLRK